VQDQRQSSSNDRTAIDVADAVRDFGTDVIGEILLEAPGAVIEAAADLLAGLLDVF
jgi:hypothetical protein